MGQGDPGSRHQGGVIPEHPRYAKPHLQYRCLGAVTRRGPAVI